MPSFEMLYDEEEDALEITFATFDESFARTIALNDNIVIYTDLSLTSAWGVSFYSYTRLLQVSETHLDGLRPLPEADARRLLALVHSFPLSLFLEPVDPGDLRARVKAPGLLELL
jgi:hypothetical protein